MIPDPWAKWIGAIYLGGSEVAIVWCDLWLARKLRLVQAGGWQ